MDSDKMMADLLEAANATTDNKPRNLSVAVQFLDGPRAGQTLEVPADTDGGPKSLWIQALQRRPITISELMTDQPAVTADVVTYTVKRSMFRGAGRSTPKWVAAIGDKVGDRVHCVQMYTPEARASIGGAFNEFVERDARAAIERTCAEAGLVPADVHRAFDGSRAYAESLVYPVFPSYGGPRGASYIEEAARAALSAHPGPNYFDDDQLQFIVYHAVAMPAPEPAAEAVTSWA